MVIIEGSITIGRPIAEVFATMADATNAPVYGASIVLMSQETDGPTALGTRWRGATKILGRDFGKLTDPLVGRSQSRTVQASLATIKELMETPTL